MKLIVYVFIGSFLIVFSFIYLKNKSYKKSKLPIEEIDSIYYDNNLYVSYRDFKNERHPKIFAPNESKIVKLDNKLINLSLIKLKECSFSKSLNVLTFKTAHYPRNEEAFFIKTDRGLYTVIEIFYNQILLIKFRFEKIENYGTYQVIKENCFEANLSDSKFLNVKLLNKKGVRIDYIDFLNSLNITTVKEQFKIPLKVIVIILFLLNISLILYLPYKLNSVREVLQLMFLINIFIFLFLIYSPYI